MKATLYQALDWFDAQGTFLDVATIALIQRQVERAREEFSELEHIISGPCHPNKLAEEAADVCICLYRVIGTLDPEAINKKMAKNRARQWNVGPDGCGQHITEGL